MARSRPIATRRDAMGDAWSDELEDAWHAGLEAVTSVMLRAHRAEAARDQRDR